MYNVKIVAWGRCFTVNGQKNSSNQMEKPSKRIIPQFISTEVNKSTQIFTLSCSSQCCAIQNTSQIIEKAWFVLNIHRI